MTNHDRPGNELNFVLLDNTENDHHFPIPSAPSPTEVPEEYEYEDR